MTQTRIANVSSLAVHRGRTRGDCPRPDARYEVTTSDLHAMRFDPVSNQDNLTTVKDSHDLEFSIEDAEW